jgi:hypothetical protein
VTEMSAPIPNLVLTANVRHSIYGKHADQLLIGHAVLNKAHNLLSAVTTRK